MKLPILIFVSTLLVSNAFGQKESSIKCEFSFGQNKEGEISLSDLLSDSVTFNCSVSTDDFKIYGFSLTTKCDGVTRYFTNEKTAALNNAMKENVRTLKPGCLIEFSHIMLYPVRGGKHNGYSSREAPLKFRLK